MLLLLFPSDCFDLLPIDLLIGLREERPSRWVDAILVKAKRVHGEQYEQEKLIKIDPAVHRSIWGRAQFA